MNAQEYISSGQLEAYVLGSLSETEAADVLLAIDKYPEVAAEVAAIEVTMWQFGHEHAIRPAAAMQDKIWAAIEASQSGATSTNTIGNAPGAKVIPLSGSRSFSLQRAAIWVALVGSLVGNLYLWNKHQSTNEQQLAFQTRLDTMARRQEQLTTSLQRYTTEADMLSNPDMVPVRMQTMHKEQPMAATVYWSKTKGESYVSIQKLPVAPSGKQYQLWVIAGGKPVSLGTLENDMVTKQGMEKIPVSIPEGQAFAISLENEGGVVSPTMDQIFVMGKVASL